MSRRLVLVLVLWSAGLPLVRGETLSAPVVIPMQKLTVLGDERVGISATLGGTEEKLYLFDTGSSPFVSAYDNTGGSAWWGTFTVVNANPPGSPITYGRTRRLYFEEVHSTATIGGKTTGNDYLVAQAYEKEVKSEGTWGVDTQWKTDVDNGVAPDQGTFFGTVGADLSHSAHGFYGFVKQFSYDSGVTEGFIVHAQGENPTVTLGLTTADTARFGEITPLITGPDGYSQYSVAADYGVIDGGTPIVLGSGVQTLFDSGAPQPILKRGTELHIDDTLLTSDHKYLKDQVTLRLTLGGLVWDLASDGSNIAVTGLNSDSGGSVNASIKFFNSYDIVYNTGNGTIGFAAVPEPGTIGLVLAGSLFLVLGWRVVRERVRLRGARGMTRPDRG